MAGRLVEDLLRDARRLAGMGARPRELATDPGAWVLGTYRVGRTLRSLPRPLRAAFLAVHRPFEALVQAIAGVSLSAEARIGGGLYLGHVGGIRIGRGVHLGRDVNLSYGVEIKEGGEGESRGAPFIGDRVYIGPGARLTGNIRVGNDAVIAANAVVDFDVPDGAVIGVLPSGLPRPGDASRSGAEVRPPAPRRGVRAALHRRLPKPLPVLVGA